MKEFKLGFLGMGNMAGAILNGILRSGSIARSDMIVCEANVDRLKEMYDLGLATTSIAEEVFLKSEYVIIAVKPQQFRAIAPTSFRNARNYQNRAIITIMAGVYRQELANVFFTNKICRVMPNLPILVGQGMSALCYDTIPSEDKLFIKSIFSSIGTVIEITENKMDAVTSISGSGPAYVYYFIDSMIRAGIQNGLTEQEARVLTLNTFYGATKQVEQYENVPINVLIQNVCSKGGTTIEAINVFQNNNLDNVIIDGIDKCYQRSIELSKK